jgi:hypothetical protein
MNPATPYAYRDSCLKGDLPSVVATFIKERADWCDGTFTAPSSAILRSDFNNDGRSDYAVYEGRFVCDSMLSLYTGNSGGDIYFFVSTPTDYISAGENAAEDARVDGDKIWLTLGGRYCGQRGEVGVDYSSAGARICERAFSWDVRKKRMSLDKTMEPKF